MAGTFTSQRDLTDHKVLRYRQTYRAGPSGWTKPFPSGWNVWSALPRVDHGCLCKQYTTSYRTGRQDSSVESSGDDLLSANSYRERFRALRKEYKETGGDRDSDTGHPFSTSKETVSLSHPRARLQRRDQYGAAIDYEGPLIVDFRYNADPYRGMFVPVPAFNTGYYGPRAISETIPTNPVSSLATSLAELKREGIPSLVGHQSLVSGKGPQKNLGGEYLNYEFGWKPLIGAMSDTMLAVSESARLLRQYQRDSGRWVRRDYTFPELVSHVVQLPTKQSTTCLHDPFNDGNFGRYFDSNATLNNCRFHEETRITQKVWFKGAYSYYLQGDNSHLNRLYSFEQKAQKLLGLRITPEVLWDLQPWSWLVDWNLNVGDNIANASRLSSDGLVIRYGYLMRTTTTVHTSTVSGLVPANGMPATGPISTTWTRVQKERVRAEPYGFGSNPQSYTGRQWAILAALGMTKAPNTLK